MSIRLEALFLTEDYKYGKDEKRDPDMIHYTRWGRIKKVLKILKKFEWENKEAYIVLKEFLEEQIPLAIQRKDKKSVEVMKKALKEVEGAKV